MVAISDTIRLFLCQIITCLKTGIEIVSAHTKMCLIHTKKGVTNAGKSHYLRDQNCNNGRCDKSKVFDKLDKSLKDSIIGGHGLLHK